MQRARPNDEFRRADLCLDPLIQEPREGEVIGSLFIHQRGGR
jgi:hypothetical protein